MHSELTLAWVLTHTGRELTKEMPSHPEMPISSSDLCSLHKMLCQRLDAHDAIVILKFGRIKGQLNCCRWYCALAFFVIEAPA